MHRLKGLQPCFLFPKIGTFLSAGYPWGLHFWRFDKPIEVYPILTHGNYMCQGLQRRTALSLAECGGVASLTLVIASLLPDCIIAMQFIKRLKHQPRQKPVNDA